MNAPHHPTGQPLAVFTPAMARLISTRVRQVEHHGHTAAADDATGPSPIITVAHGHAVRALHQLADELRGNLQMAGDMTRGDLTHIGDQQLTVLARRLITAAACAIAATDIIDRELARRGEA